MKKKDSILRIRIFYILLLGPGILWLLLSVFGVAKHLNFDTGEKRSAHEIAEGTTLGNLTEELELVYNDRVPFRSIMLRMNSGLNYVVEIPYKNAIQPGLIAMANAAMQEEEGAQTAGVPPQQTGADDGTNAVSAENGRSGTDGTGADGMQGADAGMDASQISGADASQISGADAQTGDASAAAETPSVSEPEAVDLTPYYETPNDAGYYPYIELAPEVIQGRDNWVFMTETLFDYEGATLQTPEELAEFTGKLQTLNDICKSRGQELYCLAIPNKCTAYPEYMPSVDKVDYCALNQLEDYVAANSDVRFNFMDDEMLAAKRYGQLYYLADTHWNGRGAMAAMATLHRMLGLEPIDQGALTEEEGAAKIGDLIYYTGLPSESFPEEHMVDYYYKTDVPVNYIRGGDDVLDEYTSGAADGRTLVLVGDSYRHNLLPYMIKDFAHVYFINQRCLGPEYADILNSADVLILEGVERNYFVNYEAGAAVSNLIDIMG